MRYYSGVICGRWSTQISEAQSGAGPSSSGTTEAEAEDDAGEIMLNGCI